MSQANAIGQLCFRHQQNELHFVNGSTAFLHSRNPEGDIELAAIGKRIDEFMGNPIKKF